jgi:hypothetical protein
MTYKHLKGKELEAVRELHSTLERLSPTVVDRPA